LNPQRKSSVYDPLKQWERNKDEKSTRDGIKHREKSLYKSIKWFSRSVGKYEDSFFHYQRYFFLLLLLLNLFYSSVSTMRPQIWPDFYFFLFIIHHLMEVNNNDDDEMKGKEFIFHSHMRWKERLCILWVLVLITVLDYLDLTWLLLGFIVLLIFSAGLRIVLFKDVCHLNDFCFWNFKSCGFIIGWGLNVSGYEKFMMICCSFEL
jgi:hypothetical protein